MKYAKLVAVSEIAASVPKPAELVATEASLRAVQSDLEVRNEHYNRLLPRLQAAEREGRAGADALRSELAGVQSAISDLQRQQSAALLIIATNKPAYCAALHEALLPVRKSMANRVVAAIDELKLAPAELGNSWNIINHAGGSPTRLPLPIYCDPIRKLAEKIATEESADVG